MLEGSQHFCSLKDEVFTLHFAQKLKLCQQIHLQPLVSSLLNSGNELPVLFCQVLRVGGSHVLLGFVSSCARFLSPQLCRHVLAVQAGSGLTPAAISVQLLCLAFQSLCVTPSC